MALAAAPVTLSTQEREAIRDLYGIPIDKIPEQIKATEDDIRGVFERSTEQAIANIRLRVSTSRNPRVQAGADVAAAQKALEGLVAFRSASAASRQQAVVDAQTGLTEATQSGGDVAAAKAALDSAKAALASGSVTDQTAVTNAQTALNQAEQANADRIRADAESFREVAIARAQSRGDAVEAARQQLAKTISDLNYARATDQGESAINALVAQQLAAERAVRDSESARLDSQESVNLARLEVRGDRVGIAQALLAQAQRKLAEASGQSEDVTNPLQAQVITQLGALRDANLTQLESDIDFQLEMNQITSGQAIAQLQARLQAGDLTQQQTRDLQRKIKALRDQAGQDLQFNIGDIKLPTLYEVRRLRQSQEAAGTAVGAGSNYNTSSYQDQRTVQVNLYPATAADHAQVQAIIADTVGTSNRTNGTAVRPY